MSQYSDITVMSYYYDIFKVGSRYQVIDTRDNSPVGKTHATRGEAQEYIDELYSEEMSAMMSKDMGMGPHRMKHQPSESASGTVELTETSVAR